MGKRRWLLWVLVITFVWLVINRLADIENLLLTLSQGIWLWVLAAAGVQVCFYLAQAVMYQVAFAVVGVPSRARDLVPVVLGSLFINVVAPAGGTAGLALFVDDAAQRGHSAARTAAGTILAIAVMYGNLSFILAGSLVYLAIHASLGLFEIVAALLLITFTVILSGLLILGYKQPDLLRRFLFRVQQVVNGLSQRLRHRPLMGEAWALQTAHEFTDAGEAVAARPGSLLKIGAMGLASHASNILTLYCLFLAFRYPSLGLGTLISGYAIGYLFVIVSPTPQGVGFVENIMPSVYVSLGVPGAVATITVLAYRGLTFWLPLLIGFFLLQRLKSLGAAERSLAEVWSVRIVALLTALMGVFNALGAVTPSLAVDLDIPGVPPELASDLAAVAQYSPLEVQRGGQLTAALSGLALLLLAFALWRRKRAAWVLTLLVLLFSALNHLWQSEFVAAGLAAALGGWLFLLQPHFHARSDRPSVRQALQLLAAAWVFILAYGIFGFYWVTFLRGQPFDLGVALRQTVTMMTRFYDPGLIDIGETGQIFAMAIYLLSGLTYVYVFVLLIRPVLVRQPVTADQRLRAEAIVREFGYTSQALLALWRGKSYYFSPAGSLIAYELQGRTAIALGDPIGPAGDTADAISQFDRFCRRNDWNPAFYQIQPDNLDLYQEMGFNVMSVGREGTIDLTGVDLGAERYESLQAEVAGLVARGYRAVCLDAPLGDEVLLTIHQISDEWLTMVNTNRKRIWLGWFDEAFVRQSPVVVTYNPEGVMTAFATLMRPLRGDAVVIDLLQHRSQIADGTITLLFLTLLQWAAAAGYARVHCGTSPLADGSAVGKNRVLNAVYQSVSQYTFRDTHDVEVHFAPRWSMRYLAYPGTLSLPAVWTAVLRGNSDLGVVRSFLRRRLRLRPTDER